MPQITKFSSNESRKKEKIRKEERKKDRQRKELKKHVIVREIKPCKRIYFRKFKFGTISVLKIKFEKFQFRR